MPGTTRVRTLDSSRPLIPVTLDAIRDYGDEVMARMTYFVVDHGGSAEDWTLRSVERVPVASNSTAGVLCGPLGKARSFTDAGELDDLFRVLETEQGWDIDVDDLWLPEGLLTRRPRSRSAVFRISPRLFTAARGHRVGDLTTERLVELCGGLGGDIRYCRRETEVFRAWHKRQIEASFKMYPKDGTLALKY